MADDAFLERFSDEADRIFEEMGFDPDGPLDQLNFDSGRELGKRLVELWPADPYFRDQILRHVARELLEELKSTFPATFDPEVFEFQAYLLGPLISKFLCGRGLTVPELARLAVVTPERVYRLMRAGLSILFVEDEPALRSGVNRRFSGLDGRQTHLAVDFKGITTKKWPEPMAFVQPFLAGILDGTRTWLETPHYRLALEDSHKRVLPELFADPVLGELFDGFVIAAQRVTQQLRDEVLTMKVERDAAQRVLDMLVELTSRRAEVLATFALAGTAISNATLTLPAAGGA